MSPLWGIPYLLIKVALDEVSRAVVAFAPPARPWAPRWRRRPGGIKGSEGLPAN